MKSSFYHTQNEDQFLDFISEYTAEYPCDFEKIAELSFEDEDDLILCLNDMEENFDFDFSDNDLEKIFEGEMKCANLHDIDMEKTARITTGQERAKMRQYRLKNKATLARKARKRKRQLDMGLRRQKSRVGTAAGGYSFIDKGGTKLKGQSSHPTHVGTKPMSVADFNPVQNPSGYGEHVTHLKKFAMPQLLEHHKKYARSIYQAYQLAEADFNRNIEKWAMLVGEEMPNTENPIAGKLGYPTPPKGRTKPPAPQKPQLPKVKSALTHNSLPQNKVNTRPDWDGKPWTKTI